EDDLRDALRLELSGDRLADELRGLALVRVVRLRLDVLRQGRDVSERLARDVVDDLRVDVLEAAEDGEAGTLGRPADLAADAELASLATFDLETHDDQTP